MENSSRKNNYEPKTRCGQQDTKQGLLINRVMKDSVAEELGVEAGDRLLTIDDTPVRDQLDYVYCTAKQAYILTVEKPDGELWELEVELDDDEELGLDFTETLCTRTCRNACVFCFIDQMPPGMRDTLYVKDDDERLSFLTGNYITLTNLDDEAFNRICRWHIPVNISIHTTNPELRVSMLGNRFAGSVLEKLKILAQAGVPMNGQIVCVPGYNDEEELKNTLTDLKNLYPQLTSVSVVPVGLTDFREGLAELKVFDQAAAARTIDIIEEISGQMYKDTGSHFCYASDEFYLTAGRPVPTSEAYDGFPQIENGVGMIADFKQSAQQALERFKLQADSNTLSKKKLILTGKLAEPVLNETLAHIQKAMPHNAYVKAVENTFFGPMITVSGLLTGSDIRRTAKALLAQEPFDTIYLPDTVLKNDSELLLDDITISELEQELQTKIQIIPADGESFVRGIVLGGENG